MSRKQAQHLIKTNYNGIADKIKKIDPDQPINAWLFVLILNIVGFAGYFYLKINDIHLGD